MDTTKYPDARVLEIDQIENKVAQDVVAQYEIAKNNGSDMGAYVAVGMVCAAFLQAEDEAIYKKWKAIEKELAKKVGLDEYTN